MSLATLGLLQYVSPSIQFLLALAMGVPDSAYLASLVESVDVDALAAARDATGQVGLGVLAGAPSTSAGAPQCCASVSGQEQLWCSGVVHL